MVLYNFKKLRSGKSEKISIYMINFMILESKDGKFEENINFIILKM